MATEKWIAGSGQGLTWGNAFTGSTLNSIASGNAILSDISITNGTSLDVFADVSISLASAAFTNTSVSIFIYPLASDGSTYGDGRFGSSAAGPPSAQYFAGVIPIVAATQANVGTVRGLILPPGTFKFLFYNQSGVALASTSNTCSYRTYNRSIA